MQAKSSASLCLGPLVVLGGLAVSNERGTPMVHTHDDVTRCGRKHWRQATKAATNRSAREGVQGYHRALGIALL
jgi:hypothetical protein